MESDQAWTISLQLLTQESQNNGSAYFVGAQALYQKLDRAFETELADKAAHVIELRDQILNLLGPNSERAAGYHKMVIERLCMSVAYLALHTTNTCWQTSVSDLISFGTNYGPQQCFVSLNILKNICVTFDTKMFNTRQ